MLVPAILKRKAGHPSGWCHGWRNGPLPPVVAIRMVDGVEAENYHPQNGWLCGWRNRRATIAGGVW